MSKWTVAVCVFVTSFTSWSCKGGSEPAAEKASPVSETGADVTVEQAAAAVKEAVIPTMGSPLSKDLELLCRTASDKAILDAPVGSRTELLVQALTGKLTSENAGGLMESLDFLAMDLRCEVVAKTGQDFNIDWSCPSLCPALSALGMPFLTDLEAIATAGGIATPAGTVVGLTWSAVTSPSSQSALAPLSNGLLAEDAVLSGLPAPGVQATLQVIGGANFPALTLVRIAAAAQKQGYTGFELVGHVVPFASVLEAASLPEVLHASGLGGGFGGVPPGVDFWGSTGALRFEAASPTPAEVSVVLSRQGITIIHNQNALPPAAGCTESPTVTLCPTDPYTASESARQDWLGLYNTLLTLKADGANLETVCIAVSPDLMIRELAAALDVLRTERAAAGTAFADLSGFRASEPGLEGAGAKAPRALVGRFLLSAASQ